MKKIFLLLVFVFMIATLFGCNNVGEIQGVKGIDREDIFNQAEDDYYIYFHRLDCEDCEESIPYVIQYAQYVKDNENCKNKRKIYSVLLYTKEEKPGEDLIYREYGGDGQGTDGKFYVNGISNWEELYIASTSSLISVSTVNGVKKAYYAAQGWEKISESLQDQLGTCYT
ncbi:MAG: hypothetical protein PHX62_00345 [Bacilli bacterium]|nr:hypothetical protein [Bacilli bacterium]